MIDCQQAYNKMYTSIYENEKYPKFNSDDNKAYLCEMILIDDLYVFAFQRENQLHTNEIMSLEYIIDKNTGEERFEDTITVELEYVSGNSKIQPIDFKQLNSKKDRA